MNGAFWLAWRHLVHRRGRSVLLVVCLATPIFLPWVTKLLLSRFEARLTERARTTPLLMGARGHRFDLTFSACYFRPFRGRDIPASEIDALRSHDLGTVIPLHVRHKVRGYPLVGTSPEYFEHRGLVARRGTMPLQLGDVVLGSELGHRLGASPGDGLFSDPAELYDITKPPALEMRVSGLLASSGTADDRAAFVHVSTAWALDGHLHGHEAASDLRPDLILGRTDQAITISPALVEAQRVTTDTLSTFHGHGDPTTLPLTAILFVPKDRRAGTLVRGRVERNETYEMVEPNAVVQELVGYVVTIERLFDGISALLSALVAVMTSLVLALSLRLREREMETLRRIGCSRVTLGGSVVLEAAMLLAMGLGLASTGVALVALTVPDPTRWL